MLLAILSYEMNTLFETLCYTLAAGGGWFLGRGWKEAGSLDQVSIELPLESLPPEFDGLTILHLSDLHGPTRDSLIPHIVAATRDISPDLIVITGDLARTPRELILAETLLRGLRAKFGVFCVYGNNDLKFDPERVRHVVQRSGAVLLDNSSAVMAVNGAPLRLIGINHNTPCSPRWRLCEKREDTPFTLVLLHGPAGAASLQTGDLVLAGHTHGGQIILPLLDRFLQKAFGLETLAGLTVIGSRRVYISRGIGTKGLPLRFRCRPEITTITLRHSS